MTCASVMLDWHGEDRPLALSLVVVVVVVAVDVLAQPKRRQQTTEGVSLSSIPTKKKMGVTKEIIREGDGTNYPKKGQKLSMHYRGTLASNGTQVCVLLLNMLLPCELDRLDGTKGFGRCFHSKDTQ